MRHPLEITPETTETSCPLLPHSHPRLRLRSRGSDLTVPILATYFRLKTAPRHFGTIGNSSPGPRPNIQHFGGDANNSQRN